MSVCWMGAGSWASDCFQSYASQSPRWVRTVPGGAADGGFVPLWYQLGIDLVSIGLQLSARVSKRQPGPGDYDKLIHGQKCPCARPPGA
ncbi:hypothetical protein AHiyo1_48500 [Arthrobacter sp. Hiyo1]|nr:hypothetical protein AHiyo1_48500 [Arthrobacter sp. Hiyo1]